MSSFWNLVNFINSQLCLCRMPDYSPEYLYDFHSIIGVVKGNATTNSYALSCCSQIEVY